MLWAKGLFLKVKTLFLAAFVLGCMNCSYTRYSLKHEWQKPGLILGKTTVAEAVKIYDEPERKYTSSGRFGPFKIYKWREFKMQVFLGSKTRVLYLEFDTNDILVGYNYYSSYLSDVTKINKDDIKDIIQKKTTKEEITTMFGVPTGLVTPPTALVDPKIFPEGTEVGKTAEIFIYSEYTDDGKISVGQNVKYSQLFILFDQSNKVINFAFLEDKKDLNIWM